MDSSVVIIDVNQLNTILRCPICLEEFDSTNCIPYRLQCSHTYCIICLKSLFNTNTNQRRCPTCRVSIMNNLSSLQKNLDILTFIESQERFEKSSKFQCVKCNKVFIKAKISDEYCNQCFIDESNIVNDNIENKLAYIGLNVRCLFDTLTTYKETFLKSYTDAIKESQIAYDELITKITNSKNSVINKMNEEMESQMSIYEEIEENLTIFSSNFNSVKDTFLNSASGQNDSPESGNATNINKLQFKLQGLNEDCLILMKMLKLNNNEIIYENEHSSSKLNSFFGNYRIIKKSTNLDLIDLNIKVTDLNNDINTIFNNPFKNHFGNIEGLRSAVIINDKNRDETCIIATNTLTNQLSKFKIDNENKSVLYYGTYGQKGDSNGDFDEPWDICYNTIKKQIIVSDSQNDRLQIFDLDMNFIGKIGRSGSCDGCFRRPYGLYYHKTLHFMYVCDYFNNRVQVFDYDQYKLVTKFGSSIMDKPKSITSIGFIFYVVCNTDIKVFKYENDDYKYLQNITNTILDAQSAICGLSDGSLIVTCSSLNILTVIKKSGFAQDKQKIRKFEAPLNVIYSMGLLVVVTKNGVEVLKYV